MLYNNKFRKIPSNDKVQGQCDQASKENDLPYLASHQSESHHWKITGMDCASCAKKIENSLKFLPEIERARVIYSTEKLIVHIKNPKTDTLKIIEQRIDALGFGIKYLNADPVASTAEQYEHYSINRNDLFSLASLATLILLSFMLSWYQTDVGRYAFVATTLFGLIPIVKKTGLLIRSGTFFGIETLMSVSAIGALFIGAGEEASMVLFLFRIGEILEAIAANKAKKGISSLIDLMPKNTIKLVGNRREQVSSRSLFPGDIIEASAGERLPADVTLDSDFALIDESALTGESMPVEYHRGDKIMAGSLIIGTTVQLKVISKPGQNAIDRILQLIEQAEERKAPIERFIDRFSRFYTPAIMIVSLMVALIPPLFLGEQWSPWIYRGLTLLLIGCPCALVVSTPASITSALSLAARQGVLIKGGAALEVLSRVTIMAFDKTGTLTLGKPTITDIIGDGITEKELMLRAAAIEAGSSHPIAKAIVDMTYATFGKIEEAENRQAIAGIGIKGTVNGKKIVLFTPNKANILHIPIDPKWQSRLEHLENDGKTVVIMMIESELVGLIAFQDTVRPEAAKVITQLKQLGITSIMLTGDNRHSARTLAEKLQISYSAELLPIDKLKEIETLTTNSPTAMIGDGINDSPAIKAATIGIAMGTGSDVALETADAALTKDNLLSLPRLIALSRAANLNIRQNIAFALGIKALFLVTTIFGITGLWIAVLADSGTTALVTLNALRLLRFNSKLN